MANNKVQLADGTVLIDLTGDNVQPENVEEGVTFHDASGTQRSGTLQRGAQVASGSFTVSRSNEVTIHPGFVVKSLCVGKESGTNIQKTGGGLYVDGTVVGGDIKSVYSVSNATRITFTTGKNGTFYWLATS